MENFICTSDAETANKMIKEGMTLVAHENGFWTFINEDKIKFDKDSNKVRLTNQLHI